MSTRRAQQLILEHACCGRILYGCNIPRVPKKKVSLTESCWNWLGLLLPYAACEALLCPFKHCTKPGHKLYLFPGWALDRRSLYFSFKVSLFVHWQFSNGLGRYPRIVYVNNVLQNSRKIMSFFLKNRIFELAILWWKPKFSRCPLILNDIST